MSIRVLKAGMLSTLQDRGRSGLAAFGIGRAGPMDEVAFRLANALVGNGDDGAALEISVIGPRLHFGADAIIALAGAEFDAHIGTRAVTGWRRQPVAAGDVLDCGRVRHGARAYLAVAGGFAAPSVLGSRSCDVNAGLGPLHGRPLRDGDALLIERNRAGDAGAASAATSTRQRVGGTQALARENDDAPLGHAAAPTSDLNSPGRRRTWTLDPRPWFDPDPSHAIHLIRGRHFEALDDASRQALFSSEFKVAAESNRVGFRLDGPRLAFAAPLELISEAVAFGTVQLPPGGQPIALLAEHPTTGGYPRIGQIAAIDLPRLAQRKPGDSVRFREIDLDEAQTRYLRRERELAQMIEAIATRLDA
ncbi:MAG: biotin-dependent carboxyltransferase family protein [Dokdonella sp.]